MLSWLEIYFIPRKSKGKVILLLFYYPAAIHNYANLIPEENKLKLANAVTKQTEA